MSNFNVMLGCRPCDHDQVTMCFQGAGGHLGQLGMVSGPCAFCIGLNMKIHSWALLKHTVTHTLPIFPDSAVLTIYVQF